ncbi:DUF5801 repeats-in-toxin domain-containing protein [Pseudovibrio brasiliensis]|uniref:Cadherin-like domain-containing protein n=1 Tax=Pseudovibrio brasiliensis TaxID=1898042 RepID=A0ABX8AL27_9HYPH|nr:DUF5801 repeats-in-toxin domain-containing protein [Pseudovibrio brasiliensis]QUS54384.1 cadherin-like domain-containing protein [Pseudovibrio brasiliensis]
MSERQASSTNTATNTSQATFPPQTLKIGVVAEGSSEVLVRQPGQLVDFSQMLEVPVSLFRYGESLQILFSGGGTLLVEGFFTGDQTDASLILSENQTLTIEEFGALVEILPVDTLQTAAGDGTPIADQLEEPGSSGQDFDDNPDGGPLGPGLNVNDLLKPEDNAGAAAANDDPEQDVDDVPVAGIAEVGALDETDWADAGKGPLSFTGNLNVDFGLDGVTERSLQFQLDNGVPVDRAGNPLSLTADGQPLSYEVQDLTADAANEIGDGSQLLTAKLPNGEVVFEVLLNTFTETGAYTFTLHGNLDHLEADVKDILALEFGFQAFDADGDSADSFLIVNVADDLPEIGEPTTGTVDEDGIPDIGNNNDNADGDAPATSNTITASLDIDWGADDADSEQGGVGDRSVKFAGTPEVPQGLSSEDVALVYSLSDDGTELTATKGDGGEVVFKVTLSDDAAGTYSFELMGPLDHPVANTEDDINLTFDFVATDSDGDTANSSFTVIVDDDLADITSLEVNKYVQVDESAGLDNDDTTDTAVSDLFANVANKGSDEDMEPQFARDNVVDFAYDNGADGATHTVTLSIEEDGMSSGLQTTSGDDILLYLQDGLVVGRVGGADGDAVFAIAIDEAGEVSLAQYQSIKQPDTSDHDEFVNLDGKISAVLTVTDGDGDVASQDIAIGEKIRFGDDGPTITSLEVNKYVQVDESAGLDNDDTTDTTVSDLFANVAFKGSDEDMEPQFARDNVVDFAYDNGADGATHTATLSIEEDGMSSGLQTTSGDDILLYLQNGLVVGRVGGADGDAVFAIAIDEAGEVSLAQYQSIKQPDTSDHDEFVNLDGKISAVLTVTDGDGDVASQDIAIGEKIRFGDDGPTITSLELNKYVQVDESAGLDNDDTTDTAVSDLFANVANKGSDEDMEPQFARDNVVDFAYDNGADGATHTVTLSIDDADSGLTTTDGTPITLYLEKGLVVGRVGGADGDAVFAIAIDEAGEVSLAQYQSIKQLDTSDHDEFVNLDGTISAVLTVTDGDGDVASDSIAIGEKIRFGDDGPSLTGAEQGVTVDEDDIDTIFSTGTSPDYWGFEGDESLTELWTGAAISFGDLQGVVNFGADGDAGANSFTFVNDATQQLTSLGLTSGGDSIQFDSLQLTPNITLMLGVANGRPVIGLALNSETGEFAVLQADQLDHVAGNGENTALQLSDGTTIDAIDFGSVIVARDGDGDTVELGGKLDVTVVDDVPEPHIWVDDHIRIDETEGDHSDNVPAKWRIRKLFKDIDDKGSDPDLSGPIYARNDVLDFHRHVGADDRGSHELVFRIDEATSDLTTTEGAPITLTLEDGQIVGRVPSGEAAFAIHLHQNGKVSMVQYMSIEHPDTESSDEHVSLNGKVTAILTVTDEDGDAVSTEIAVGDLLTFDDDGPRVTNQQRDVTIDEDDIDTPLSTGTSPDYWGIEGDGNWTDFWTGSAINTGSLQGVVDFGADGDAGSGSFTFAGDAEQQLTDLGLTSDGDAVEFQSVQLNAKLTLMVGIADGRPVIGLILNSETGEFAVLQADQLDHVTGNGENTALQLSDGTTIDAIDFGSVIVATDGDGDTVDLDGKLDVTVVDDIPEPHIWIDDHIRIDETEGPHSDNIPPWFGFNTFKDVDSKGSDPDLSGPIYARNDVLDFHRHVGADERGSHEVTLEIAQDGISSGLYTTGGLAEGKEIFLFEENGMIVGRIEDSNGRPNGEAVFAIHVHQNGNVSMVQYMSIEHPDTTSSDEHVSLAGKVTAVLTVTDEDGDTVSTQVEIGEHLTFDDDGPHIEEFVTTGETVELDETSGLQHDEVNAAPDSDIRALFAAVEVDAAVDPGMETIFAQQQSVLDAEIFGGADGVSDDDIVVTLEISTEGLNSGLQTTEGVPINLYTEGDLIVGRAGDGDAAVIFAVSIDDNGTVSVVQYASLEHTQPGHDESLDLGDKIVARLTITDGDGDTDTATTVIGDKIIFHDDEPNAIRSGSQIVVDEATNLGAVVSGQLQFEEGADGATVTGAHFRNSQGYVRRYDMEEPRGQRGDFLTVGGEKIVLSSTTDASGIITLEGTTETSGSAAFTVVVQPDGSYDFTQILGFDHPDAGEAGSDDSIDLRLRFTVTDGDGDTSTATAVISVQDDEVVLTGDAVTAKADEDDIVGDRSGVPGNQPNDGNGDGSTTGTYDVKGPAYVTENIRNLVDFGNDGGAFVIAADAVSTLESMDLKSGGEKLSYVVIGSKLVGYLETTGDTEYKFADDHPVFSLELTSDNGDVVFKLFDQLDHIAGHLENEHSGQLMIDFGSVIDAVDGDGDRVDLDGKFTIQIVDDVPSIDYNAYEKNLVVNGSFEQPDIGSSYDFFSSIDGWQSTNGTDFEIHSDSFSQPRDGEQYLELDMDAGGAVDGIYQNIVTEADAQYELLFSLADRADNGPSSEVRVLWNGVEVGVYSTDSTDWMNISVNVVGTGQNGGDRLEFVEVSGSSQNNGLGTYLDNIQLYKTAGYVDEAALGEAEPVVATESLGIMWGADDANTNTGGVSDRSVVFDTSSTNPPSGLSSDGVQLVYEFSADGTTLKALKGSGGDEVFTVTLSDADSGSYIFTLVGNLDHDVAGSEEELLLYFGFTAKDSDGDTAPGSFRVVVNDDLLEIGSPLASTVDEDGLLDGNKDSASGDAAATSASASDVSLDINWGADDGVRTVTFASNSVLPAGVTSDGVSLVYTLSQGDTVLTATKAGSSEVVFVVTLSDEGTGSYSFDLKGNLDHPAGDDENDIDLSFEFVATDGDGDTASSSFTVTVDDDMPVIGVPVDSIVDEDGLSAGNKDDAPGDAAATETMVDDVALNISWGADNANSNAGGAGDRSVTFASNSVLPTGLSSDGVSLVYTLSQGDAVLTATKAGSSEVVFVVTLSDEGTGSYSFDLKGNLDHPAGDDENDIDLTFNFVAQDSDGDTASSNFTVTVDDDSPVLDDSVYGQNLVVNGSFEDPDIGSKGHKAVDTMSGWMSTNGTRFEIHSNSFSPSSDGEQYLELDKDAGGTVDGIYQNIITDANTQYELSFDLADRVNNSPGSDVRVLWNGVEVGEGVYSTDSTDWSNFKITVVGTGQAGGDRLEFIELTTPGQNNGLGTYLDNIQLHKVGPIVDEADIEGGSAVASDELHIKWGADDAASGANARAVTFADSLDGTAAKTDGNTDLKSAGSPVFLKSFGAVLIGYTDVVPQSATDTGDAVFKVTLSGDGSGAYTFELLRQLDHEGAEAEDLSLTFDFVATDSDGDGVSGDFTVNIVDDVPTGAADNASGEEDLSFKIDVLANDEVGADKAATILLENGGATDQGGIVTVNPDGTVQYTSPQQNFNGSDSFSYVIEDADGDRSEVVTVTVEVTPVNDRPELTVTNVQSKFAENGTGPVAEFSAFDVDGDALTYSLTGDDAHLFEIRGNEVYFKAAPDFENPLDAGQDPKNDYDFNIVVSDGEKADSEDISVSVTDLAAELSLFFKPGSSNAFTVRDDFEAHGGSYSYDHSHNNGVINWSGAWTENGNLDGDSDYGDVYVPQQGGAISGHLYFPHWTPNGEGSISRSIDLTNGENVKLEVSVGNRLEFGDDQFDLVIEWDGGSARIPMFDQSTAGRSEVITIDISNLPGWNPSETTITFDVSGMEGNNDYARVLDVKIFGDIVIDPTTEHDVDFTLGGEGVAIANMLGVDDGDNNAANNQLSSAVITLKNYQQGDALSYIPQGAYAGISATVAVVGGSLVLTLSGEASHAAYVAAIKAIEFNTSSNDPVRTIEMVVSNGSEESGVATTTINVIGNTDNPSTIFVDYNEPAYSQNKFFENDPDMNPGWHYRLNGTDQNDRIEGQGNWHNDMFGGEGNDLLIGDDWHPVSHRNYSDTFNGGAGYDRMTSGSEDDLDTFIFDVLDGSFDTVTDFDGTAQGEVDLTVDRLDISALLNKAFGDDEVDAAEAGQYVKIQENGSGSDVLVDVDGVANGENWSKIAHLDNISQTDTIKVVLDDDGSYTQVDVVA